MTTKETIRIMAAAGALLVAGATPASDVTADRQAVAQAANINAKTNPSTKADASSKACTCPAHGFRVSPPGSDPEIDRLRSQGS